MVQIKVNRGTLGRAEASCGLLAVVAWQRRQQVRHLTHPTNRVIESQGGETVSFLQSIVRHSSTLASRQPVTNVNYAVSPVADHRAIAINHGVPGASATEDQIAGNIEIATRGCILPCPILDQRVDSRGKGDAVGAEVVIGLLNGRPQRALAIERQTLVVERRQVRGVGSAGDCEARGVGPRYWPHDPGQPADQCRDE